MSVVIETRTTEERLARFLPLRIILRKGESGRYFGLVEQSFAMDWQAHRVLIFWSGKARDNVIGAEWLINAEDDVLDSLKHYPNAEAFDPCSPECPIAVDLASWLDAMDLRPGKKFDKRNAFFEQR